MISAGLRSLLRLRRRTASFEEVGKAERAFYRSYIRDGMTVVDAGANVGELTVEFARLAGHGTVYAFEPSSRAFSRLRETIDSSGFDNVVLNQLALADEEGSKLLHVFDDTFLAWSSFAERPLEQYGIAVKPVAAENVQATTIDLYCASRNVPQIDLLKIDVEGAELQVMMGARAMLEHRRIACVVFEFGQTTFDMGNSPRLIEEFLASVGYCLRNLICDEPVFPGGGKATTAQFAMHMAIPC